MKSRARIALLFLSLLSSFSALANDEPIEPCADELRSAMLLANLEQIGFAGNALRLLDGQEDPKLKRLLSWQLATKAAEARRRIEQGVKLAAGPLPNIAEGVKRAEGYVTAHPLDPALLAIFAKNEKLLFPPEGRHLEEPAANLAVISAWLTEHQRNAR